MSLSSTGTQPSFADVDGAGNAATHIDYLDAVRAAEGIQRIDRAIGDLVAAERPRLIVEIGSGTGDLLASLVGGLPSAKGLGIEKSEDLTNEARLRHQANAKLDFLVYDLMAAPPGHDLFTRGYWLGCADVILLNRVVQHLADPVRLMANAKDLLGPFGAAVLCDVDWTRLAIDHPDPVTTALVLAEHVGSVTYPAAGGRLAQILAQAGFRAARETFSIVHQVDDFGLADSLFRLTDAARRLAEKGVVSSEMAESWLRTCRSLDEMGRFRSTIFQAVVSARA